MEKIKVSREVANSLNLALKVVSKEKLLNDHFSCMNWKLKEYEPLNELSNWKMAQILINDYEVEETPEEKILNKYLIAKQGLIISKGVVNKEYSRGIANGIEFILDALNIKIKGIND